MRRLDQPLPHLARSKDSVDYMFCRLPNNSKDEGGRATMLRICRTNLNDYRTFKEFQLLAYGVPYGAVRYRTAPYEAAKRGVFRYFITISRYFITAVILNKIVLRVVTCAEFLEIK